MLLASIHMEADIAEVGTWLGSYLRDPKEEYKLRILDDTADFWQVFNQFKNYRLTEEEAGWAAELGDLFSETQALSTEIIELEDDLNANLAAFVDLRTRLDAVLDDEIQVLTYQALAEATQVARDMKARTNTMVLLLLLGGLACGTLVAVAITRGITDPVEKLVAASRAIARGDLSLRANIQSKDEFGILGDAFNEMTVQRQRAQDELEMRVQERTAELSQVNEVMDLADEVARIVTSTLNIDEVYEKFACEVKKLVDHDVMNINLIDREAGVFATRYLVGENLPKTQLGDTSLLEGTRTQHIIETRQTLVRSNTAMDRRFPNELDDAESGLLSSIALPLISKGESFGVLSLRSRLLSAFGPREQAILERLAGQIAPAIENSQLYGRLQASMEEMDLADEVGRIVTTTLNIDEVYEKFALELKKLVDFDQINIKLVDLEANNYTLKYLFGPARAGHPVGTVEPLENSQTLQVAVTQRTFIQDDIGVNPTFRTDDYFAGIGLPSNITVPLLIGDHVIGTLSLRSRRVRAYGPKEQAILERLALHVAPALENARLYQEQVQAQQELRASEERLRSMMEKMPDGLLVSIEGKIIYANQALATMLGCECADFQGQSPLTLLHPEDQERATHWMERMLGGATGSPEEYRACSKDGAIVPVEVSCRLIDYGGKPALLSVLRDLTERKLLEGRLSQAQKLETVGRLAGGVAHDFNNVLTAIMGYTQLSLLLAPAECEISDHLQEIKKAADRAANLTGQLLAFSRQQVIEPKVLDLNDVVINLGKMLRRLIGEDIELITLPATELDLVKADPGQIEQVLLNLAVNARDAMPDGGKLTIKTACVTLDAEYVRHHEDASPGRHVMLVVSDTGTGISEEVQKHMFEPFFTTKMVGKGTGLGLATCFGIVQQSGGHIEVETEPGQGTSFKVYLPVTEETYEVQPKIVDSSISPQGNETVLLAEDESMVRSMVATVLRDRGYV
ncbi:MAG: PAS domain S-box protein, partial [Chloroflexi bacterium]|nr:PAS domain S-box protein [Chloroflexota bacterium]